MPTVLTPPLSAKPRYTLLDGLRGVGALIVIIFHFGEAFSTGWQSQMMNHGYLAVDFFFILSGFVIGYAYDGRWRNGQMTARRFMLRRFIRLHPMVVLAIILGAAAYILQGCVRWDGTPMPPESVVIRTPFASGHPLHDDGRPRLCRNVPAQRSAMVTIFRIHS